MKPINIMNYIMVVVAVVLLQGNALADELGLDASKIMAVVPVKSGNADQSVYRQFDRIVPELKKLSKTKIVKLECRYSGRPDREQDVINAYKLAGRIEKYLREHHKLDLDLWIVADVTSKSVKSSPVLTIAVFPDAIKKLDAVQVDPTKN